MENFKKSGRGFRHALVERISGGKDGGGSKLTQEGEELLEKYEKFIQEMNEYAKVRFKEIFEDE